VLVLFAQTDSAIPLRSFQTNRLIGCDNPGKTTLLLPKAISNRDVNRQLIWAMEEPCALEPRSVYIDGLGPPWTNRNAPIGHNHWLAFIADDKSIATTFYHFFRFYRTNSHPPM